MAINKSFGYIAEIHGIPQYPKVMLGLLAGSAMLLYMVCSLLAARSVPIILESSSKCALRVTQLVSFVAVCHVAAQALAENWSQFRGTNANGVVSEGELPVTWGPDDHVLWKVSLPGNGWSQPIVWGERIFVTTAETDNQAKPDPKFTTPNIGEKAPTDVSYRWKVLCLDAASGKTLWDRTARDGQPTIPTHRNNTYASETPATDGERVVAYFGMTGVYCYDFAGNLLWTRDLGTHPTMFGWGTGSSPILFGDKVYIQCDNDEASFLVALDKRTGKDVWRVDRDEQTNWSTPYIWKNKNRTELVTAGGSKFRSYDPESGKLLWSMTGSGRTATIACRQCRATLCRLLRSLFRRHRRIRGDPAGRFGRHQPRV